MAIPPKTPAPLVTPIITPPVTTGGTPAATPPATTPPAPPPPATIPTFALSPASPSTPQPVPPAVSPSVVQVTVPNTSGQVTFSLVVTDNLGQQSQNKPTVTVTIQPPPVAALTGPTTPVPAGSPIQLSGTGSTPLANIKTFTFSLVPPS
jgi:hypothetical protein